MKKFVILLLCVNLAFLPAFSALVEDEFVNSTLDKNLKIGKPKYTPIEDNILQDSQKEIKVKIKNKYSTKDNFNEGEYIDFITLEDAKIKNKNYPKGSTVKARIETVSQNKSWGVPSDLVVGNFTLNGNKLTGEILKTGANRSLWVYPAVIAGCMFLGAGLLLIPIRGGHAKIRPSEVYTLRTTE